MLLPPLESIPPERALIFCEYVQGSAYGSLKKLDWKLLIPFQQDVQ